MTDHAAHAPAAPPLGSAGDFGDHRATLLSGRNAFRPRSGMSSSPANPSRWRREQGCGGTAADTGLTFTRCRPYRKNDKVRVEQKNGAGMPVWAGMLAAPIVLAACGLVVERLVIQ